MNRRVEWIDTAKGLGIFFVVLGHALPDKNFAATVIWTFHMPLFFFLSGLTTRAWGTSSLVAFSRGLKNLAIPYLFFSIVSIILWQALQGNFLSTGSWLNLMGQMAYGVAGPAQKMSYNVPLWFFTCLFSVRILFALVTAFSQNLRTAAMIVITLAVFFHTVVLAYFNTALWNADIALVGLFFYTAGYIVSQLFAVSNFSEVPAIGWRSIVLLMLSCIIIMAVAFINGRVDMNGRSFGSYPVFYIGALAGIYATIVLSRSIGKLSWLGTMGQASIVIFPLHTLWSELPFRIMPTLKWYGFRITHSDIGSAILVSTFEIALCVPIYFALRYWTPALIGLAKTKAANKLYQNRKT